MKVMVNESGSAARCAVRLSLTMRLQVLIWRSRVEAEPRPDFTLENANTERQSLSAHQVAEPTKTKRLLIRDAAG
jgi:hypothetical protein